jgi:hypothetical protein
MFIKILLRNEDELRRVTHPSADDGFLDRHFVDDSLQLRFMFHSAAALLSNSIEVFQ